MSGRRAAPGALPPERGARYCQQLVLALRALRLNRSFPDRAALSGHLEAVAVAPPGEPLALCPRTGWPHPDEWLRVIADRSLAPSLLARLAPLVAAGDAPAAARSRYLEAMAAAAPAVESTPRAALVERTSDALRAQVTLERLDLSTLTFARWTWRLHERRDRGRAPRLRRDEAGLHLSAALEQRLRALAVGPLMPAVAALSAEPGLSVEEVVLGAIGPALPGDAGPWLSATLSRAAPHLARTSVDDPVDDGVLLPDPWDPFKLSHHRKWAAPEPDLQALRGWLSARGSRNLAYTYPP